MSVLTNADYKEIRSRCYRSGQGKEELKAHSTLPNETALKAGFQALEDRWESDRLNYKSALDTALGVTTTAAEARFLFVAWIMNRIKRGL